MNINPHIRLQKMNRWCLLTAWLCYLGAVMDLYQFYAPKGTNLEFVLFVLNLCVWLWNLLTWEKNKIYIHNNRITFRETRRMIVERSRVFRQSGKPLKKVALKLRRHSDGK